MSQGRTKLKVGMLLDEARQAYQEKNYSHSLEIYKAFFDESSSVEGFGAVRLSYCLKEWAELGQVYPPALRALKTHKDKSLAHFNETLLWDDFDEFYAICDYLKCTEEAINVFYELHDSNKQVARTVFYAVYKELARNSEWQLCKEYLGNGYREYELTLKYFDLSVRHEENMEPLLREEHKAYVEGSVVEDIHRILEMLYRTEASDELARAVKKIEQDFTGRGRQDLYKKILSKYDESKSSDNLI